VNIQIGLVWIGSAKMGPCPTLNSPGYEYILMEMIFFNLRC